MSSIEEIHGTDPRAINRPDDSLLTYYLLVSLASLPLFPFVFIPLYIRFKTLRYRFDDIFKTTACQITTQCFSCRRSLLGIGVHGRDEPGTTRKTVHRFSMGTPHIPATNKC